MWSPLGSASTAEMSPSQCLVPCKEKDLSRRARDDIRRRMKCYETSHSVMILPQVHLRKPCYDFYFL